jgi:hypothetical protein
MNDDLVLTRSEVEIEGELYVSADKFIEDEKIPSDSIDKFFVALEIEARSDPTIKHVLVPEWPEEDYMGCDTAYPYRTLMRAAVMANGLTDDMLGRFQRTLRGEYSG